MNSILFSEFKDLLILSNESLNESKGFNLLKKLKDKILLILEEHKDDINGTLPKIIDYINDFVSNLFIKRKILSYLASIVLVMGLSFSEVKAIYNNKNVDNLVEWKFINNDSKKLDTLKINYNLGEYKLSKVDVQKIENFIKINITDSTIVFKATIKVTISKDLNNPDYKNYAIDDTQEEKEQGGKLLEKRIDAVNKVISLITSKIKDEKNIDIKITVISDVDNNRYLLIDNIEVITKDSKSEGDIISKDDTFIYDDNFYLPGTNGKDKDISKLSRNYQMVEILKLGGIDAKRIENDDYENGDKYSKWILNFRKSVKMFLSRLQKAYPEYDIYFDKESKAINPVTDARKGISNIDKQYTKLNNERIVLSFNSFVNENIKDTNEIYDKWNFILGKSFPDLTKKQAVNFDQNIDTLLHYLEQIYGGSSLDFTYKK